MKKNIYLLFAVCLLSISGLAQSNLKVVYVEESRFSLGKSSFLLRILGAEDKVFRIPYTLLHTQGKTIYQKSGEEEVAGFKEDDNVEIEIESNASDENVYYRNHVEGKAITLLHYMERTFLVEEKLSPNKWTISKETKKIGNYLCKKAFAKSKSGKKEIIAWYAPEIPVNEGPDIYFGLPGLILELHIGENDKITAQKISFPKEIQAFNAPEGGKKMTREEYDAMREKKSRRNKKKNSDKVEIIIEGEE